MLTVPVKSVTVLLFPSRAVILMVNGVPAVCDGMVPPAEDSTRKLLTGPAEIVKAMLVSGVRLVLVAISCFDPGISILRLLNVAVPLVSVTCAVIPLSVPVPDKETLMEMPDVETLLPRASFNRTVIEGVIELPDGVLVGSCTKATRVIVPTTTVIVPELVESNEPDVACICVDPTRWPVNTALFLS